MTASQAIPAYGTILQASNGASPAAFLSVAEILSLNPAGMERDKFEVSHMESPKMFKEYIALFIEGAAIALDLNYLPQDPSHKAMLSDLIASSPTAKKAWRVVWPDLGARSVVATVSSGTWTSATAHGFATAQPVRFASTSTLPTGIIAGTPYWARVLSTTTFALYPSSRDAFNATSALTITGSGSGTITCYSGTVTAFNGFFTGAKPSGSVSSQLKISSELTVTGPVTSSP